MPWVKPNRKKGLTKAFLLGLLILADVFVFHIVYKACRMGTNSGVKDLLKSSFFCNCRKRRDGSQSKRGIVTGIIHSQQNSHAIIDGRCVREGDIINGAKVVRINPDSVEFRKDDQIWKQKIGQETQWPGKDN